MVVDYSGLIMVVVNKIVDDLSLRFLGISEYIGSQEKGIRLHRGRKV